MEKPFEPRGRSPSMKRVRALIAACVLIGACTHQTDTTPETMLSENVKRAIDNEALRSRITVSLRISGAPPSEGYYFFLEISGQGAVEYEFQSHQPEAISRSGSATISNEAVVKLLKRIHTSGVLELPQETPRFIPDTLVGMLEISDGDRAFRMRFAADPEQAETQGQVPPPALMETTEALYALGTRVMDVDSVKP